MLWAVSGLHWKNDSCYFNVPVKNLPFGAVLDVTVRAVFLLFQAGIGVTPLAEERKLRKFVNV